MELTVKTGCGKMILSKNVCRRIQYQLNKKQRLREVLALLFFVLQKRKEKRNEFKKDNESAAHMHNACGNAAGTGVC